MLKVFSQIREEDNIGTNIQSQDYDEENENSEFRTGRFASLRHQFVIMDFDDEEQDFCDKGEGSDNEMADPDDEKNTQMSSMMDGIPINLMLLLRLPALVFLLTY